MLSSKHKSLLLSLLVASIGNDVESFAPTSRIGIASVQQTPINQNAFQTKTTNSLISPTSSSTSQLSALSFLDEETTQKLIVLSFEKLIDAGIPSIFFIITSWWFISQFRNQDGNSSMMRGGSRGSGRGSKGRRGGRGRMSMQFESNERPLGPVEELYDDIYDDLSGPQQDVPPLLKLLGGGGGGRGGPTPGLNNMNKPTSKLNIGIPSQQYLKVTKLNTKYDSYRYSMIKATKGKAVAASELRGKGFDTAFYRALGISSDGSLDSLTQGEGTALLKLERDFLSTGSELIKTVAELSREITNAAVLEEMQEMGVEAGVLDAIIVNDDEDVDVTDAQKDFFAIEGETKDDKKKDEKTKEKKQSTDIMKAVKELEAINTDILLLELDFIQNVVDVLGPNRADAIRTTVVGNMINGEAGMLLKTLKERLLATVLVT